MRLESPVLDPYTTMPRRYTCEGENISPPLSIRDVPPGTVNLALALDDPDAPGGRYIHWFVFDIPITTTEIAENIVPFGARVGRNDNDNYDYDGPCPPGDALHRYHFRLYALDETTVMDDTPTFEEFEGITTGHILATAELVVPYQSDFTR